MGRGNVMNTSIVVCGQKFNIGSRVVLWNESKGFNGYDTSQYSFRDKTANTTTIIKGKRYSNRSSDANLDLQELQEIVKQLFLHHSGLYRAETTFNVLHKQRKLSCHFILDDDGVLYQTLDLKEKAWHGGVCNSVSIGVEIDSRALAGKFPFAYSKANQEKYKVGPRKKRQDNIQGVDILGYEYSEPQYRTLIRLGITILEVFPKIKSNPEFPKNKEGKICKRKVNYPEKHNGFICHFHITTNKVDPIAFDFDRFLLGVKNKDFNQPTTFKDNVKKIEEPNEDLENLALTDTLGVDDILFPAPDTNTKIVLGKLPALNTIREIQAGLVELGYDTGGIDGLYGRKTISAIKSFQKRHRLNADGVLGDKTKRKLEQALRLKRGLNG